MGVVRALCRPAGNAALSQLRRRQIRSAPRYRLQKPGYAAHYAEETRSWTVAIEDGRTVNARFLITAIGPLSTPTLPRIEGRQSFTGQSFHTARWPQQAVDFKRQARCRDRHRRYRCADHPDHRRRGRTSHRIPAYAELVRAAAQHGKIDAETQKKIKAGYPEMFARCQETFACFLHTPDARGAFEVTDEGARHL